MEETNFGNMYGNEVTVTGAEPSLKGLPIFQMCMGLLPLMHANLVLCYSFFK